MMPAPTPTQVHGVRRPLRIVSVSIAPTKAAQTEEKNHASNWTEMLLRKKTIHLQDDGAQHTVHIRMGPGVE